MSSRRTFRFSVPESYPRQIFEEELQAIVALSGAFSANLRAKGRNLELELLQPYGDWGTRGQANAVTDAALSAAQERICRLLQANITEMMLEELLEFRDFVERQGYRAIVADGTPREEIGRTLLQALLVNRSYKEVPVRGGRSDILVYLNYGGRILIETKLWRGRQYHDQAIAELEEYARGENDDGKLAASFLIVFDNTEAGAAAEHRSEHAIATESTQENPFVVIIRINLPQPSKNRSPRSGGVGGRRYAKRER